MDQNSPAIQRYLQSGNDLTLLVRSLRLTPTQRLEELISMIEFAEAARQARQTRTSADIGGYPANRIKARLPE